MNKLRHAIALTSTGAAVSMALLFVETTLAARLVPTQPFGIYVLIVAIVNFLMMLVDVGSRTAVIQLIARSDARAQAALVNSALVFRIASIGCISVLVWLARDLLVVFGTPAEVLPLVNHVPLMVLAASLDQLLFGMLQGFQEYRHLAIAQILRAVLRVGLTFVLLAPLNLGIVGLLYSWTLSFAASATYQFWALPVRKRWTFDRSLVLKMLQFGAPLQLAGVLWFLFSRVQTFILGAISGPASVAQFAVAARIPEALQQLAESYMAVYLPKMTALLSAGKRSEAVRLLDRSMRVVSFGAALTALLGVLLRDEITQLVFSSRYAASAPAFGVLMLALHLVLVVNLMGYTLTAAGHPRRSLTVDIVRTSLLMAGSLALIPIFSFMGAANARLVSGFPASAVVVRALRGKQLDLPLAVLIKHTAVVLACAGASIWLDAWPWRLTILAVFIAVCAPHDAVLRRFAEPPPQTCPAASATSSRKRICIIAFKDVPSTVHVLRQIHYLSRLFELTVIGHGHPDPAWPPLTWYAVPQAGRLSKLIRAMFYAAGRWMPPLYLVWYWQTSRFRQAYAAALASGADALHANDWQSLPIAIEVARRTQARVVFHQHEFAEREREDSRIWRLLVSPALRYLIARYTRDPEVCIDTSITVCRPIAERYQTELQLHPVVVYNAPAPAVDIDRSHPTSPTRIRMIHHGYAQRSRGIDRLIEVVALLDSRFTLDLMLMDDDPGYLRSLKQVAQKRAPGRVLFRRPVRPHQIVSAVAEYDIGLCVIQPRTYNTLMMLPNKLFEYVQAGLAVCVGPSPAMVDIVQSYDLGICSPSFAPEIVAAMLNRLTVQDIEEMRQASRRAAVRLNADVEMQRVVELYEDLLDLSGARVA